ncbi:MAG: PfkB family carbohydrate kinase [Bacillota bacterium]
MTRREKEIYRLIKKDPYISQKEIANLLDIKRSSVGVHISNLIKKGKIKGKGYILNESDYIIVIGGSNIDIQGYPENELIFEDSNPGKIKTSLGGVARNISENLARLDQNVKLLSVVGEDLYGRKIIDESKQAGVDISDIIISKKSTSIYLSILDKSRNMKLAISDMNIIKEINVQYLKKYHKMIKNNEIIVIDTNLNQDVIDYIFDKYSDKKIFVDTVSSTKAVKIKKHLKDIYFLKPNSIEAGKLLDLNITTLDDRLEAVKKFVDLGINNVVLTSGKSDICFGDKNQINKISTSKVNMVNTTGAGDAFMAGIVYAYKKDFSLEKMIKIGNKMSKLTIESPDTISKKISESIVLKED